MTKRVNPYCHHLAVARGVEGCFVGPVVKGQNQAAHWGITYVETCLECGAKRATNQNGRHFEYGPWVMLRDAPVAD